MTEAVTSPIGTEDGLKDLLMALLENDKVAGVITLCRVPEGHPTYELITDPQKMERSIPLYPLMPTNLGQVLDRLTRSGPPARPLAVVAHPCEMRAFIEQVKRRMGHSDNIIFISHTCAGVFPTHDPNLPVDHLLGEYQEKIDQGATHPLLRPACRSCVEFVPYTADLVLRVVDSLGNFVMLVEGERGRALIDSLPRLEWCESEIDQRRIERILNERSEERERQFAEEANVEGLNGLVGVFGRCIGCHACSKACPICHCNLCSFETSLFERSPEDIDRIASSRSGTRLPPDTIFFHLGRMVHMATSCVACGSCQDVCPVDIPVALLFKKVGESLQQRFNYVPGRDLEEPLPVSTFEVEEFVDIERRRGDGR